MAKRVSLSTVEKLDKFPFDTNLLSCQRRGAFPDLAIRINAGKLDDPFLCGGELVELKDSKAGYSIASFNSTIPTASKKIADLVSHGGLGAEMESNGDDVHSLPERQVYYLLRGKKKSAGVKICLVHGSFFETVSISQLIGDSFRQVFASAGFTLSEKFLSAFARQDIFSSVRKVEKSSVSLRFRIMTEARKEANILKNYTAIADNTLNLVVPLHGESETERNEIEKQILTAAQIANIQDNALRKFHIKHPLNGFFLVLSVPIHR